MAVDMTVEELIGLLQEQHPQALVLVERDVVFRVGFGRQKCNVFSPYGVRTTPRNGRVYIICDSHDC